jgi:UDP-N-acetylmuramoylalanine--D-glutamate ligase
MNLPEDILIVGLGRTGIATARFLAGMGKRIAIADEKTEKDLGNTLDALEGIEFKGFFGPHRVEDFVERPLIVISPGVDNELPALKVARAVGVRVIGEMELAASFIEEPIIAITGTNGKTTVTTLLGEIFNKAFSNVFVGGNIGNPLINYVLEDRKAPFIILEVSSFQLETIEAFRPKTALLLNITEDHLDRYRSFEEYRTAKYRIFENQSADDYAILNRNLNVPAGLRPRSLFFSAELPLDEGAFYEDGTIHIRLDGQEHLYRRDLSPLVGIHNTENLLAVLLTSHIHNVDRQVIEAVMKNFRGLPHRVEFVRDIGGVRYYNDSKATNVDAAKRALESMDSPVVLIAGGKDKGGSYGVAQNLMSKVKALILFGEGKERIRQELGELTPTVVVGDLGEAVAEATRFAQSGDIVLFSPMCSSFDMFRDYKERGNTFRAIVESM